MVKNNQSFISDNPEITANLARRLSGNLHSGDTILLSGPIGVGKSHFARSVILEMLAEPEDVPSPTYLIVQTYETPDTQIWHIDLYRLGAISELHELGLSEAFESAICLIEWPDQYHTEMPDHALHLTFEHTQDNARSLNFMYSDPKWFEKLGDIFD